MTPIILRITDLFDRLDVPYLIGGSIASMIHGVIRTTLDADIVADLREDQVESFAGALADEFYLDADSIHDAIRRRRCFNIIHLATMIKVDIFIPEWDDFHREEFKRRQRLAISTTPERMVCVASIEDTILAKLTWFRLGGQVSDRQWRDVIELLKMHGEKLDRSYLDEWAADLQVRDLLERALQESLSAKAVE
jgi:hypothetical protein